MSLDWRAVALIALPGLVIGTLSLFGLYPDAVEFGLWTVAGLGLWVPLLQRQSVDKPLVTGTFGGVAAGILTGTIQALFATTYIANHPAYAGQDSVGFRLAFIGFGIGIGAVWGLLMAGIALGVRRIRRTRNGAPA